MRARRALLVAVRVIVTAAGLLVWFLLQFVLALLDD